MTSQLDAISVSDALDALGAKPQAVYYRMSAQSIALIGQMEAAFVLLNRPEADGLLSQSDENYYPSYYTLLEAGQESSGCGIAARVHAAVNRLSLSPLLPVATTLIQVSDLSCENGENGECVEVTNELWPELRRRSLYTPHLQVLPWGFVKKSAREQQESSQNCMPRKGG